jgi:hypothetical protein
MARVVVCSASFARVIAGFAWVGLLVVEFESLTSEAGAAARVAPVGFAVLVSAELSWDLGRGLVFGWVRSSAICVIDVGGALTSRLCFGHD